MLKTYLMLLDMKEQKISELRKSTIENQVTIIRQIDQVETLISLEEKLYTAEIMEWRKNWFGN